MSLSWTAPAFDGGSPVTNYKVYRGTSPGAETFLANAGDVRRRSWRPGLTNGTTYYYKVSAENANGEGPLSNEASATPTDLVPPVEPLPTVDDFDRTTRTRSRTAGAGRTASTARRRDGSLHDRELARLLEDDDLHRLA